MTTRLFLSLALVASLAACGTRMNPMNWFGSSTEETTEIVEPDRVTVEDRVLIDRITAMTIEPSDAGAILRIIAQSDTPGAYDVTFVGLNGGLPDPNGVLTFEMRVRLPDPAEPLGLKVLNAAHYVGAFELQNTDRIIVKAAENQRSVRR